MQFEQKGRRILLEENGRFSEVSPLQGWNKECTDDALTQLKAIQNGYKGPFYPSVAFGLYGLTAPHISSVPYALFLSGKPDDVIQTAHSTHGAHVAKLKVGHWDLATTLSVIRSIPLKLRLDFNLRWQPSDVLTLCSHLSPKQIEFLEDPGCTVPGFSHASDSTNVWKPTVRGLPPHGASLILSSAMESSIGLHNIAALTLSHAIVPHILGIGTLTHISDDLVQNPATYKDGHIHFPTEWQPC